MRYDANAIRVGQAPDPVILGGDTIVVDDFDGQDCMETFPGSLGGCGRRHWRGTSVLD